MLSPWRTNHNVAFACRSFTHCSQCPRLLSLYWEPEKNFMRICKERMKASCDNAESRRVHAGHARTRRHERRAPASRQTRAGSRRARRRGRASGRSARRLRRDRAGHAARRAPGPPSTQRSGVRSNERGEERRTAHGEHEGDRHHPGPTEVRREAGCPETGAHEVDEEDVAQEDATGQAGEVFGCEGPRARRPAAARAWRRNHIHAPHSSAATAAVNQRKAMGW